MEKSILPVRYAPRSGGFVKDIIFLGEKKGIKNALFLWAGQFFYTPEKKEPCGKWKERLFC